MRFFRLFIAAALSMVSMQSFAQTPMDALRGMLSDSAVSIDAVYEMPVSGTMLSGSTRLLVQGDMYHMKSNGLELYCNGKVVWTIDEAAREVVIEPSCDVAEEYVSSPVLILSQLDRYFEVLSQKSQNGQTRYQLSAIKECGIAAAVLVLSSDGMIVSGEFTLNDGNVMSLKVTSMKKTEEMPSASFSPQKKFSSDWVVTDLR